MGTRMISLKKCPTQALHFLQVHLFAYRRACEDALSEELWAGRVDRDDNRAVVLNAFFSDATLIFHMCGRASGRFDPVLGMT